MNNDICPISGDQHRYFIFKVVEAFEPVESTIGRSEANGGTYYQKVEYALMGCNCGSAIKKRVEQR